MSKLGVVKNFLKFKPDLLFGVIGGQKSNICYLSNKNGEFNNLCVSGFAESIIIWNLDTKEIVKRIVDRQNDNVTYICNYRNFLGEITISVGYESGFVSVYSLWNYELILSLKCHKHPITNIIYTGNDGGSIICGSMDTNISVIDIDNKSGFCLKGHNSPITKLQYITERDILISSSQDGSIKLWFLSQKHCFKTITNNCDTWDFVFVESSNLLITGSSEPMLNLWKLSFTDRDSNDLDFEQTVVDKLSNTVQATLLGNVDRDSTRRVMEIAVDKNKRYMAFNTSDKKVEIFKIATEEEISKKLKKKIKKAKTLNKDINEVTITPEDHVRKHSEIYLPNKCKSLSIIHNDKKSTIEILASLKNNTIAIMELGIESRDLKVKNHISRPGHRTPVIYSQFTSDGLGLLTVSLSEAKIWNKPAFDCLLSINWPCRTCNINDEDYEDVKDDLEIAPGKKLEANTAVLLPGDRHAVIGFKTGVIILYNLCNGDVIQWINAHEESITSLVMTADNAKLFSSSTDKTLKVWKIEYGVLNSGSKSKLQLSDTKVCHTYKNGISKMIVTPDSKTLIVAQLNSIVQSWSLTVLNKRILDFYKHSQPVVCMDVKHDSSELLTGSGDKTVIKWCLTGGDCKIFKGHKEGITDVKYLPGRSLAFSCDKSGLIIQINLKNMTEIIRLRGHGSQITSLSIMSEGGEKNDDEDECIGGDAELVSVSTDCSIRVWFESDEILSREVELEEERNRIIEEEDFAREDIIIVGGPQVTDTGLLTKKTLSTEYAADEIMEAMDNYFRMVNDPKALADPKMIACKFKDPQEYFLFVFNKIHTGDLENILAQLPMKYVENLFILGADVLRKGRGDVFLMTRSIKFLETIHFKTIVKVNTHLSPVFKDIATYSDINLRNIETQLGFFLEGLDYLQEKMGPEWIKMEEKKTKLKPKSKKK